MLKLLPTVIGCLGLIATATLSANTLKTQEQKASYLIGLQLGKQLMISKDDIDLDAMKLGMKDMFSGQKPQLSNDEMTKAMKFFQESKKKRELAMMSKFSGHNKKEGEAYLASNKKQKGVVTLASGLQ